jgi:hypothetical protein
MNRQRPQIYTFEHLEKSIKDSLENNNLQDNLKRSVEGISKLIESIIKTKGKKWETHMINKDGKPLLSEEEKKKFNKVLQPYIHMILKVFNKTEESEDLKYFDEIADKSSKRLEQAGGGPDDVFQTIINKIKEYDLYVKNIASDSSFGILHFEKEHDSQNDIKILSTESALLLAEVPVVGELALLISKIPPIPVRFLITLIYLFLDIMRISFSVLNFDKMRKIMSILIAILDFLKGDWKKAILTFAGYYGMYPLLFGQIGKVFLTVFQMINPEMSDDIIYGSFNTLKSILLGTALSILQITANKNLRETIINKLEPLSEKKKELDEKLVSAGLQPLPDYMDPSFGDINNLQAIFNNDAMACSKEIQETISSLIQNNPVMESIIQLLGIPTNAKSVQQRCGIEPLKSYTELLADMSQPPQVINTLESPKEPDTSDTKAVILANQTGGRMLRYKK